MNKKIIYTFLVLVLVIGVTGCGKDSSDVNTSQENIKEEVKNTSQENINEETKITDYSGTYENEDSSFITITKDNDNYKATISIYRLTTFAGCTVDDIKDDVLYISGEDPNENTIEFTFDYKTKILTVRETTWGLLTTGDTFEFDK